MSATHPVDSLADRYGDRSTAVILGVVALAGMALPPDGHPAAVIVPLLAVVAWATSDGLDLADDGLTELQQTKREYVHGEIGLDELEQRADVLLDDGKQQVRSLAETVNGVGPATSLDLAERFDSPHALKQATPDDLEEIHGIGPSTAEKIGTEIGPYGEEDLGESDDVLTEVSAT